MSLTIIREVDKNLRFVIYILLLTMSGVCLKTAYNSSLATNLYNQHIKPFSDNYIPDFNFFRSGYIKPDDLDDKAISIPFNYHITEDDISSLFISLNDNKLTTFDYHIVQMIKDNWGFRFQGDRREVPIEQMYDLYCILFNDVKDCLTDLEECDKRMNRRGFMDDYLEFPEDLTYQIRHVYRMFLQEYGLYIDDVKSVCYETV